jgi:hypothetical protein
VIALRAPERSIPALLTSTSILPNRVGIADHPRDRCAIEYVCIDGHRPRPVSCDEREGFLDGTRHRRIRAAVVVEDDVGAGRRESYYGRATDPWLAPVTSATVLFTRGDADERRTGCQPGVDYSVVPARCPVQQ